MTDESIAAELSDEQIIETQLSVPHLNRDGFPWGDDELDIAYARAVIAADRALRASPEVLRASSGSLREAFRAYYACYEDVGTIGYFYSRADAEEAVRTSKFQKGSWTDYGDCVQSVGVEEITILGTILGAALSPSGPMISLNAVAAEEWRAKLAEQCGKTLALQTVAAKLIAAFDKPSTYAPLSDAIESVRAALANTQGTEP